MVYREGQAVAFQVLVTLQLLLAWFARIAPPAAWLEGRQHHYLEDATKCTVNAILAVRSAANLGSPALAFPAGAGQLLGDVYRIFLVSWAWLQAAAAAHVPSIQLHVVKLPARGCSICYYYVKALALAALLALALACWRMWLPACQPAHCYVGRVVEQS